MWWCDAHASARPHAVVAAVAPTRHHYAGDHRPNRTLLLSRSLALVRSRSLSRAAYPDADSGAADDRGQWRGVSARPQPRPQAELDAIVAARRFVENEHPTHASATADGPVFRAHYSLLPRAADAADAADADLLVASRATLEAGRARRCVPARR